MTRIDLGNVKGSKGDAIQIKDLTSAEKKELLAYSNLELTDKEIQEAFNKLTDSQQDRIKGDKGDKGDKGTLDYEVCSQNPLNTYYNHIIKAYYDSQTGEFHKSSVENSSSIISIVEGYYNDGKFYKDESLTDEITLTENTVYYDLTDFTHYHSYNGSLMLESEFTYVDISKDEDKIKGYYNSANSQFYLERNFETLIKGNDEEEYLDLVTGDTYNYDGFVWTRIEPVYDAYKYDTDDGFVLYDGGKVPIPTKLYIYNPTGETGEYDNQVNDVYFYIEIDIDDVKYGRFINLFNSEISNSLTVNSIGNVDIIKDTDGNVLLEFYVNNYFRDIVEVEDINLLDSGEEDKVYVDLSDGKNYRWSGSTFVDITTLDLNTRLDTLEEISVTKTYLDTLTWTKEDIVNFAHHHDIEDIDDLDDHIDNILTGLDTLNNKVNQLNTDVWGNNTSYLSRIDVLEGNVSKEPSLRTLGDDYLKNMIKSLVNQNDLEFKHINKVTGTVSCSEKGWLTLEFSVELNYYDGVVPSLTYSNNQGDYEGRYQNKIDENDTIICTYRNGLDNLGCPYTLTCELDDEVRTTTITKMSNGTTKTYTF